MVKRKRSIPGFGTQNVANKGFYRDQPPSPSAGSTRGAAEASAQAMAVARAPATAPAPHPPPPAAAAAAAAAAAEEARQGPFGAASLAPRSLQHPKYLHNTGVTSGACSGAPHSFNSSSNHFQGRELSPISSNGPGRRRSLFVPRRIFSDSQGGGGGGSGGGGGGGGDERNGLYNAQNGRQPENRSGAPQHDIHAAFAGPNIDDDRSRGIASPPSGSRKRQMTESARAEQTAGVAESNAIEALGSRPAMEGSCSPTTVINSVLRGLHFARVARKLRGAPPPRLPPAQMQRTASSFFGKSDKPSLRGSISPGRSLLDNSFCQLDQSPVILGRRGKKRAMEDDPEADDSSNARIRLSDSHPASSEASFGQQSRSATSPWASRSLQRFHKFPVSFDNADHILGDENENDQQEASEDGAESEKSEEELVV